MERLMWQCAWLVKDCKLLVASAAKKASEAEENG